MVPDADMPMTFDKIWSSQGSWDDRNLLQQWQNALDVGLVDATQDV